MPSPGKVSSITPRTWLIVSISLLSVALIAGGVWAFVAVKGSYVATGTTPADESARAYRQGVSALSSDQTGTAVALLEEAVKLDPGNSQARSALESAKASGAGDSGGASPANPGASPVDSSPTKPGTKPAPVTPAPVAPAPVNPAPASVWLTKMDPVTLLPQGFGGYSLGKAQVSDPGHASVGGQPKSAGAPVAAIAWHVRDSMSPAAAAAFVSSNSRAKFSHSSTSLIVNGVNAYYGVDGAGSSVVAYTRGRYVFEVVVTAQQPANSQDVAEKAAAAFVTNP